MQEFYKKALLALICLLVVDALLAVFSIYRTFPTRTLMPLQKDGARWHYGAYSDVDAGGTSSVRLRDTSPDRLRFNFTLKDVAAYPFAAGDLKLQDDKGRMIHEDWSKFATISFVAKCSLATAMAFEVSIFDEKLSEPGKFDTYLPPRTFFSCNEQGMPVTLDLARLLIPDWW